MRYWYYRRRNGYGCWLFNTRSSTKLICILAVSFLVGFLTTFSGISRLSVSRSLLQNPVASSNAESCPNIRAVGGRSAASGPTNFPLILPHVEPNLPCEDRKLFLAVVVNSAADEGHFLRRIVIRKTWGILPAEEQQPSCRWKLFFALGLSENDVINIQNQRESLKYNDVLVGNFTDTYKNVVIKTFMSHYWVYLRLNCQYILKADDDVYIRVPRLADWLIGPAGLPTRFYGGCLQRDLRVIRDPRIKWFLPREVYNETNFPPFSKGSFQVVSADMLPEFFYYTQFIRKPFFTDDAYFGVMARDLGLTARQIPMFRFFLPRTDNDLRYTIAFGHQVDVVRMLNYHGRYEILD